jgi:microcystin-dependent protein
MTDIFLGEVRMFGGNFAPRGWMFCNGQLLSIAEYTALYSLIGTTYGGNGQTNFALPDLRGRVPMNYGQGPGLSPRVLGEAAGTEQVTILQNQMPAHNHLVIATTDPGSLPGPVNNALTGQPTATSGTPELYATSGANPLVPAAMSVASIGMDGGNLPHDNMMPSLAVSFIIAVEGMFPSRN